MPKELIYAHEFILIGDSYYNVKLIESVIVKFKSIIKSKSIFFLNKKNMTILKKDYNITHKQFKNILNILGYERDKKNLVKYILRNKKESSSKDILVSNKKNINSPFSILKNLVIN